MNFIKCEKLEKSMAELQFSIDAEAFKAAVADVFKKEGKKYAVPGFRKGKAPRALIEMCIRDRAGAVRGLPPRVGAYSGLLGDVPHIPDHRSDPDRLLYAHAGPQHDAAADVLAGRSRAADERSAGGSLGRPAGTGGHHPRQRVLGGQSPDRGVQPPTHPAAGWGADGPCPPGGAAAAKSRIAIPSEIG